ncbi:DUF805 domain-containing protein [Demequina sp. SYSU T00068]|uniref:DUF805 domain-containing protein n=1 Tax=Demequina lignilytica TaxID=3051663 RepID=UPI0026340BDF|nr:DUF805 domain-containing protein [Demequina sp. SYSU T00068]MDN4490877.1 DUF805 domain-containing protein [Demequina sp. SYSU T00068]
MNGFTTAMSKYAQFSGRSRRSEFWGYHLTITAIVIVLSIVYGISAAMVANSGEGNPLAAISLGILIVLGLAFIVPTLAVNWRRCQDVGMPGAVAIIGLVIPLVMWIIGFIPGTEGPNAYGDDPKS